MKLYALENTYVSTFIGWPNEAVIVCQVSDKQVFKWVLMLLYSSWGQLFPYHTGHRRYLIIVQKLFKYSVGLDEIHENLDWRRRFGLF